MAEIIDIFERLGRPAPGAREREDGGTIYRVRLCGPDRRWLGAVGGVLARALALEGFYTSFEDAEDEPPVFFLRIGRELITECGVEYCPGLVVVGDRAVSPASLQGSERETLVLVHGGPTGEGLKERFGFTGTMVPLPVSAALPEPLGGAAACIGGAARLLGIIRWTSLEQALREELVLFDSAMVNRHLAMALEAFDRTVLWAGRVTAVPEEIDTDSPA